MSEEGRKFEVRKYQPSNPADRSMVRHLCCETGFLGNPIDPVFQDRELFADYLTAYYTDREPESAFLLLVNGEVKGYLLGSRFPLRQKRYDLFLIASVAVRGVFRYPRYNAATREFIRWILSSARKEVPDRPPRCAHFHINMLAEARNILSTRALIDAYLNYLHEHGEKQVYGQMVTFEGRRGAKMFERYGFRVINKSRISKYDKIHSEPVYLTTVLKDLDRNERLYSEKEP